MTTRAVPPRELAKLDTATRMLAEVRTVVDATRVVDMAEAARVYARKAQLGLEAQNHAGEIKLRAERKAGELLGRMEKNRGTRLGGNRVLPPGKQPRLSDIDVSKAQSSRWQAIASLSAPVFEGYLRDPGTRTGELTEADLLRMARQAADRVRRHRPAATALPDGIYSVDWYSREPREGWAQYGNEPEAFVSSVSAARRPQAVAV